MFSYILVPLFIAKIGRQNYTKVAVLCGILAPICFIVGYGSYSVTVISIMMALAGIFYGGIVPAPKILMLSHPEVSGPRAGTALGLYVTAERIGISFFTATLGSLISTGTMSMNFVLTWFWVIQFVAPILIFVGIFIKKHDAKKAAERAGAHA
jgi:MFS family permease